MINFQKYQEIDEKNHFYCFKSEFSVCHFSKIQWNEINSKEPPNVFYFFFIF